MTSKAWSGVVLLASVAAWGACAPAASSSQLSSSQSASEHARAREAPVEPIASAGIREILQSGGSRATLVNVWSTWCDPCVEELPDLFALRRDLQSRGFALLLVSADFSSNLPDVRRFLGDRGVDFLSYIKSEPDAEFIGGLHPEWSGLLPLSLLYNRRGELVKAWFGKVRYAEVAASVKALLEEEHSSPH